MKIHRIVAGLCLAVPALALAADAPPAMKQAASAVGLPGGKPAATPQSP